MEREKREKAIREVFIISVIIKGANALLEIVGGFLVLFIKHDFITRAMVFLTQEELSEDPQDFIARSIRDTANNFSISSQRFGAIYLLSHGLIKIFLVAGLLQNRRWAYPTSIIFLVLFILYQIYRYSYTGSSWLIALTVFDIIVIWLIWHEYKIRFLKEKSGS